MGVRVWLLQYVVNDHCPNPRNGSYRRAVELPIAPFPGLALPLCPGDGSEDDIVKVFISSAGAVVCDMGGQAYELDFFDEGAGPVVNPASWEKQLDYHTAGGWEQVSGDEYGAIPMYHVPPPTDEQVRPLDSRPRPFVKRKMPAH